MSFNIEVDGGSSIRLPTAGKYCDRDIVVTANGGQGGGYDEGYTDGKQAEYDRFWDAYQQNGERTNYNGAFMGIGWTQETFKPKYPIAPTNAEQMCQSAQFTTFAEGVFDLSSVKNLYMVFRYATLESVPRLDITGATSSSYLFGQCAGLKSVHLVVAEKTPYTNTFYNCSALTDVTIEGTIGQDMSFQWSNGLTVQSAISIITHLADYNGTDNEYTYTLTLTDSVWEALEEYGDPDDITQGVGSWQDYVDGLGWNY